MAYARRSRGVARRGYRTSTARRAAPARRRTSRRTGARASSRAGGQTLRIVVEQVPASAVSRPGLFTQVPQKPSGKAKL